jgi:hypothetical protein
MYWIHAIVVLLLLGNVENFKLNRNRVHSHLQNQPSELKAPTSITRQLHTCLTGCIFTLLFNDSLVIPESCSHTETDHACEMLIFIDYQSQEIFFDFFNNAANLTIGNISYDSAAEHLAYINFNLYSVLHIVDYTCATGDYCDWEYAQETIPKLILLNYQPLINSLLPKIFNPNGHPDTIQCYTDTELVNCSSGSCQYFQSTHDNYTLQISRGCGFFNESSIEVGTRRYIPGPAIHDYNVLDFICNYNGCNSQSNEYEIRQIVASYGNEYINIISATSTTSIASTTSINSSGTKFSLTSFSLYLLDLALIIYLK